MEKAKSGGRVRAGQLTAENTLIIPLIGNRGNMGEGKKASRGGERLTHITVKDQFGNSGSRL